MNKSSKRIMSRILSFVMIVSAMFTNLIVTNAGSGSVDSSDIVSGSGVVSGSSIDFKSSGPGNIDVWDFGGIEESNTALYTNHINRDFLDNFTAVGDEASGNKGKFINGGTFDLGGELSVTTNANDRLFYDGKNGIRSYGDNAKSTTAYSDGYTANGMWYANGIGGDNRRFFQFDNVLAGTEIKVYAGCSNSSDGMVEFTAVNGTQAEEIILPDGACDIVSFIAKESGSYKLWFSAAGGKPIVNRLVKTPPVEVNANINLNSLSVSEYGVSFKNDLTGDTIEAVVSGTTATATLTPGYSYTATLTGAVGFGFTNATKRVDITTDDLVSGVKTVSMDVETKSTYKATGKITGFTNGYDVSKLVLTLIPDADSLADTVIAVVGADLSFEATLEPDVVYTASIAGVNDYEIISGGIFTESKDINQDITVAMKTTYTVSGKIVGGAIVTSIAFVNVEDGYSYGGVVDGDTYTVILRSGSYEVKAVADHYTTSGHIVVENKNVNKDILFVPDTHTPPTVDTNVKDIYVGCEGMVNNFATMKEALEAAKVINPTSEAERVTIHIAPGTYREQISVETPYVTFVPEGNGEVVLSWYYGIGYRYYSVDKTGYYNEENAFDKYEKDTEAAKWGVGTYVKKTANGFKAENITFEASFNKYITDEEIADGVTATGILPERNYALDVTSKAATERSTALIVEADQSEFKNCKMIGSQDTLYMGDGTHTYYKNCMIEGNTDYIFGSGNAVFDGCELRYCGYSDLGMGGYITAGRSNNAEGYMGYLFRACTVTNKEGMKHAKGYYGRPWDAGSDITFLNTTLENTDAIADEGWTSMSGVAPESAKFKEYGTMLADGTPVDTSKRVTGTVLTDEQAKSIDAKAYLGWNATYYVEDTLPVEFTITPYFSTDGDVLLPATGNTFVVKYSLGANDDNDASKITYILVKDGIETVIKSTTAAANSGVKLTNDMIGSVLKATVTPCTILGNVGTAKSTVTEKEITLGSGSIDTERPSGKSVIFLAGDSTVKDYSAGAINNSGANRPEGAWGEFLGYFVNDNYEVMDYAQGGRSSRTFIDGTSSGNDRYLDKIKEQMVAGDYLFIQFGHNDSSASYVDRYVPVGTPDANGVYPYIAPTAEGAGDGTFKWYLQQYVDAAKAVGATPVMVTPVSRMYFNSDGTIRSHHGDNDEYVTATKQVAEENGILCFDLYSWTKNMYENAYKVDGDNGESSLAYRLFAAGEKTHHSKLGGFAIAADLAEMIQNSTLGFANAIVAPKTMYITDDKNNTEFVVNNSGVFTGYGRNTESIFDTSVSCEYWTDYINNTLVNIVNAPEATTEITTEVSTEMTTVIDPPIGDFMGIEPVVVSQADGKLIVDYNIVNTTGKGFNNYTMFFTFDSNVLTPISVEEGDISIDIVDAVGTAVKENAANAANITNQFNDVPAANNNDFPGADGIKTQAELGKIKVSYCIFDKEFTSASGSLPAFNESGKLFTVTYDIKGDLSGSTLATLVNTINAVSSDLNIVYTPNLIKDYEYKFPGEVPTENTTEATTEETTVETTTIVNPPEGEFIGIEPVVVSQADGKLVVDYNLVNTTNKGFNNYTMFFTFDSNVLTPISVEEGDISIDIVDAMGIAVKENASNAVNITNQFANVPAATNDDFPGADGIKTQAELGKIKVSYCIFDKEFTSAASGPLPAFNGSGKLFSVTYDIKGDLSGSTLATIIPVINAVSSDLNIVHKPTFIKNYEYKFSGESTTENTTETTTEVTTITDATTEATTNSEVDTTTEIKTDFVVETSTNIEVSTEATTGTPVTESPTEFTTRRPSTGSSGAGASSLKVQGYTKTITTESITEITTKSNEEKTENNIDSLPYIKVVIDSRDIIINGNSYAMDVAPYIQSSSNSTMVPLRFVAIAIAGGDIEKADTSDIVVWDAIAKTATIKKGDTIAVFTADSNIAVINGVEISMNYGVVSEIKDSRMFVPFRVIGEALGADVDWDEVEKAAYYNKK